MPGYYVYRHIRKDTNTPFYIGVATIHDLDSPSINCRYKRAFDKKSRNKIWDRIVKKTEYDVDVLLEFDNRVDAIAKEMEFISLYGRMDIGTGTLCNLTDGGDGLISPSKETINKIINKSREKGCYKKSGAFLEKWVKEHGHIYKGKTPPPEYPLYKKTYVYNSNFGSFVSVFNSRREAAELLGIKGSSTISLGIKEGRPVKGYWFFNSYMGDTVQRKVDYRCKSVYKFDFSGELVSSYTSLNEAANLNNIVSNTLCTCMKEKKSCAGYFWSYFDKIEVNNYRVSRVTSPIGVTKNTCSKCGEIRETKSNSYCRGCAAKRMRLYRETKKMV